MSILASLLKNTVAKQPKKVAKKALKESSITELMKELRVEAVELKTVVKYKVKFRNSPVAIEGAKFQSFPIAIAPGEEAYLAAVLAEPSTKKTLKAVVDKKIANFEKALPPEKRAAGLAKLKEKNAK
jgi:hypothetical protein